MRLNYTLVALCAVLAAAGLFVLGKGEVLGLTTSAQQLLAICGLVIFFLLAVLVQVTLVRRASRKAAMRDVGSAELGPPSEDVAQVGEPLSRLRSQLQGIHGRRWRYRQPWLLVTGDDTTIGRLLPALVET
ncbi:hypothetical protein AB4Z27_29350, partial [Cupriavidus sp. KB_39]